MTADRVEIRVGDCLDLLRAMPDESVDCCVTSPPYWGLRAYGGEAEMIGLEATLDEHIARLVEVFREVRRVLKSTGTLWLNYGDAYASSVNGRAAADVEDDDRTFRDKPIDNAKASGLASKNLLMLPARLALALQADGWWIRSEIIWSKPNPMPESVRDRPTSAHEKIYLMTKAARYFFDAEAIKEPASYAAPNAPDAISSPYGQGFTRRAGKNEESGDRRKAGFNDRWKTGRAPVAKRGKGHANGFRGGSYVNGEPGPRTEVGNTAETPLSRNCRNVWTIATAPFSEAHFATFPPTLAERCIKAGSSEKGVCLECGKPWERDVEIEAHGGYARAANGHEGTLRNDIAQRAGRIGSAITTSRGFSPSCACNAPTAPAVVLDPFGGAGTTGLVAARLGRRAILLEISPEYAQMARRRIDQDWMGEDARRGAKAEQDPDPGPLFGALYG